MITLRSSDNGLVWSDKDRARMTADFIGMAGLKYYDVEVRVKSIADNAAVVVSGGQHRVVLWSDMSYASKFIARNHVGERIGLKIRSWS